MIRVKLVLEYGDKLMAESLYKVCLQESVSEPKTGIRAIVKDGRLILFFKSSKPSKMAERIRSVLGLLHMAEQEAMLLKDLGF
jgi:tRNA threonylcarbamoyladenosine modification (KEOPS) complex  Pcc1 subunit